MEQGKNTEIGLTQMCCSSFADGEQIYGRLKEDGDLRQATKALLEVYTSRTADTICCGQFSTLIEFAKCNDTNIRDCVKLIRDLKSLSVEVFDVAVDRAQCSDLIPQEYGSVSEFLEKVVQSVEILDDFNQNLNDKNLKGDHKLAFLDQVVPDVDSAYQFLSDNLQAITHGVPRIAAEVSLHPMVTHSIARTLSPQSEERSPPVLDSVE